MHAKGRPAVGARVLQGSCVVPDVWWRETGDTEGGPMEKREKRKGQRGGAEFKP